MQRKEDVIRAVNEYRIKYALEGTDENLSIIVHFINNQSLDKDSAIDQTSNRSNDFGIDGWFLKDGSNLNIYQSKLSESKQLALRGVSDLVNASSWLEGLFTTNEVERIPDNPCLYNLFIMFSKHKSDIKQLNFVLLSPFSDNELEDSTEAEKANEALLGSKLNSLVKISLRFEQYCLTPGLKKPGKNIRLRE